MSDPSDGATGARAVSDPHAADARLRGRTYAIPFDQVWAACVRLADGGLPRWRIVETDDEKGILDAIATTFLLHREDDVHIRIGLDENGQTRVDLESASRGGRDDLGRNARRIAKFCRRLDIALNAGPAQILDPTRTPTWTS